MSTSYDELSELVGHDSEETLHADSVVFDLATLKIEQLEKEVARLKAENEELYWKANRKQKWELRA